MESQSSSTDLTTNFRELEKLRVEATELKDNFCAKILMELNPQAVRFIALSDMLINWICSLPIETNSTLAEAIESIHPFLKGISRIPVPKGLELRKNSLLSAALGTRAKINGINLLKPYECAKVAIFLCHILSHNIMDAIVKSKETLGFEDESSDEEENKKIEEAKNTYNLSGLSEGMHKLMKNYVLQYRPRRERIFALANQLLDTRWKDIPIEIVYRYIAKTLYNFTVMYSLPTKDSNGSHIHDMTHRPGECMDVKFVPKGQLSSKEEILRIRWTVKAGKVGCLIGIQPGAFPRPNHNDQTYTLYKLYNWIKEKYPNSGLNRGPNFIIKSSVTPDKNPFLKPYKGGMPSPTGLYHYTDEGSNYLEIDDCDQFDVIERILGFDDYDFKKTDMIFCFRLVCEEGARNQPELMILDPDVDPTKVEGLYKTLLGKLFKFRYMGREVVNEESLEVDAYDMPRDEANYYRNGPTDPAFIHFLGVAKSSQQKYILYSMEASKKRLLKKYMKEAKTPGQLPRLYREGLRREITMEESEAIIRESVNSNGAAKFILRDNRVKTINIAL